MQSTTTGTKIPDLLTKGTVIRDIKLSTMALLRQQEQMPAGSSCRGVDVYGTLASHREQSDIDRTETTTYRTRETCSKLMIHDMEWG